MNKTAIQTPRLKLVPKSLAETRASIDAMPQADRAELSADWLALLDSATYADPWILGFNMMHRGQNVIIGQCGFKGPPTADGMVEIAYYVEPDWQGNGYATEAAQALTLHAFQNKAVRLVRAHTLPEANASTGVLTKCGFRNLGEIIDPDDGPVWRWERRTEST